MSIVQVTSQYVCALNSCTRTDDIIATIMAAIVFIVTWLFKFVVLKLVAERLTQYGEAYFRKHPVAKAIFLHYHHQHEVETPQKCEDGNCRIVKF